MAQIKMTCVAFTVRYANDYEIIIKYDKHNESIASIAISYINNTCYECILSLFDHTGLFTIDVDSKILTHNGKKYDLIVTVEPSDFKIFRLEHIIRQNAYKYPFRTKYNDALHKIIHSYMTMDKPHAPIEIPHDYLVNYPIKNEEVIAIINKAQIELKLQLEERDIAALEFREPKYKFNLDDFMESLKPYAPDPFPPRPRSKLLDPLAWVKTRSSSMSKSMHSSSSMQPHTMQPEAAPVMITPEIASEKNTDKTSDLSVSNISAEPLLHTTLIKPTQELQPLLHTTLMSNQLMSNQLMSNQLLSNQLMSSQPLSNQPLSSQPKSPRSTSKSKSTSTSRSPSISITPHLPGPRRHKHKSMSYKSVHAPLEQIKN